MNIFLLLQKHRLKGGNFCLFYYYNSHRLKSQEIIDFKAYYEPYADEYQSPSLNISSIQRFAPRRISSSSSISSPPLPHTQL